MHNSYTATRLSEKLQPPDEDELNYRVQVYLGGIPAE